MIEAIEFGYRDRNVHELVCHELAERMGEYRRRGIEVVAVADPAAPLSAALGGSVMERLLGRREWVVRQVYTVHPLFWIWGRGAERPNGRIAMHPEGSIPWRFTQRVLGPGFDGLEPVPFSSGPDADIARLDALVAGDVELAVTGSSVAPSIAQGFGLTEVAFFGDALTIPTTGVAVDAALIDPRHPSITAIVDAHAAALRALRARDPRAAEAVLALLPRGTAADAEAYVERYLAPGYGPSAAEARRAGAEFVTWLEPELGAPPPPAGIYDLSP